MATFKDTIGFNKGTPVGVPALGITRSTYTGVELDFKEIDAARVSVGASSFANTDILEVIPIQKNTLVIGVGVEVLTAQGSVSTVNIGDGSDANGWIVNGNLNSVATFSSWDTANGYANGKLYTSDDTIDITFSGVSKGAKIRVFAVITDCSA